MYTNDLEEALTYSTEKPDVLALSNAYSETVAELSDYFDTCQASYSEHHNLWPGKSRDLRKHGSNAFPWEGSSDLEAQSIKERMHRLISMLMSAYNRANVQANPIGVEDGPRSAMVRKFLKWMMTSGYIDRIRPEMELGASYMLERGLLLTYVGWHREDRTINQRYTIENISQQYPEIAEMVKSGKDDEELMLILSKLFPTANPKKTKKSIKELRKTGKADFPVVVRQVNCPTVETMAPDGGFLFPPHVTDPQRSPYCFRPALYSVQELKNKVSTDGWDQDFVDCVIDKYRGVSVGREAQNQFTENGMEASEMVEIIHAYQRLVDKDDNSEAIYETVFHKNYTPKGDEKAYAKFELLNGYENYPVVVTKLFEREKRLYDVDTVPLMLRGLQHQIKNERDSRVDRNSISTVPPLLHRIGQQPDDYGPGRMIPYRTKGDIEFGPTPAYNPGSVEMEKTMEDQCDKLVGLDLENPMSQVQRQYIVDKFLDHVSRVLNQAFKMFQRFGPDEIYFRVTSSPDPVMFNKGDPNENYDVSIGYDTQNDDPKSVEMKLNQMASLIQMDRNGRLDVDSFITIAASSIDPVLADQMLQSSQEAQKKLAEMVTNDLSSIYAGIERPALQNGAQAALQMIDQYSQQPDIMQRIIQDESFRARLEKYQKQYLHQIEQANNAVIGRIGTAPAQVGEIETQGFAQG